MHLQGGCAKESLHKEVLVWYRDEDVGDLALNDLKEKSEKSNQNIVMYEEFVKNTVMNEKFVKYVVMHAGIEWKVVMDLSMFKIGGWNTLQDSNPNLLDELTSGNRPWLLLGIQNKDPFFVTRFSERHSVDFRSTHGELDVTS